MNLIQKSMSGKIVENKYGRFIYSDTFDENSPKYRNKSVLERAREYWDSLGNSGLATNYSTGLTKARGGHRTVPYAVGNQPPFMLSWQFASTPAGNIGDIYVCAKLLQDDMFLGGRENHSALGAGGGPALGAYGTYAVASDGITCGAVATVAKFLAAADWDAAATTLIGNTMALGFQYVPTTDVYVCCTNSQGVFATAGVIDGHLLLLR